MPATITDERATEPLVCLPVCGDKVEVELPNGYCLRIDPGMDGEALRQLLNVLGAIS